jgi:hypothetical protein
MKHHATYKGKQRATTLDATMIALWYPNHGESSEQTERRESFGLFMLYVAGQHVSNRTPTLMVVAGLFRIARSAAGASAKGTIGSMMPAPVSNPAWNSSIAAA